MTAAAAREIKLGLIGVGIERSRAPELHRIAGRLCGIAVRYDLIALTSDLPGEFDAALSACRSGGYAGVNVTHPFKEQAALAVDDAPAEVRRLGAVNTVRFQGRSGMQGANTDYTGFKRAFRSRFGDRDPGTVAIVGAGGVGRAIAFGLADLGAQALRLFDQDQPRAERLALALQGHTDAHVLLCRSVEEAAIGADGLVNATPLGMHRYPGTPIPRPLMSAQSWAFDAVYTPTETAFLQDAAHAGLQALSGYELFFYQGVDAFQVFTGLDVDEAQLREALNRSRPES